MSATKTPGAGTTLTAAGQTLAAGVRQREDTPAAGGHTVMIDAVDYFSGPGGWDTAARALGLGRVVGIERDAAACLTRAAAGHVTVRADVSGLAPTFAAKARGLIASPPCVVFSAAGKRAGAGVTDELADLIRDAFAGRRTRAAHRRRMARALRMAWWPSPKLTRAQRSAKIWAAVRSASLVAEPARFIAANRPEWVALEQVPAVLPLWRVYAAELAALGYSVWTGKLNAADYGVAQTRERAILIASRVRKVRRPEPTHYDPRKGMQLWGEPWISMAEALGWGATVRPVPTVTGGGVTLGGWEPFAKGGREALSREQEAGRWALRHQSQREGRTTMRTPDEPAFTVTGGGANAGSGNGTGLSWVLHTNRDQRPDGTRQTSDPLTAPAPALTAKSGGQWQVKLRNNNNACERSPDEPAGTLFFGQRSNWAAWVAERPATVQGDPRVGRPGHKERVAGGESQFAVDSVRITVEEAAALQSFPPGYPWRGTKSKQFEQVGNAVPPLLAMHILAMATGIRREDVAA